MINPNLSSQQPPSAVVGKRSKRSKASNGERLKRSRSLRLLNQLTPSMVIPVEVGETDESPEIEQTQTSTAVLPICSAITKSNKRKSDESDKHDFLSSPKRVAQAHSKVNV